MVSFRHYISWIVLVIANLFLILACGETGTTNSSQTAQRTPVGYWKSIAQKDASGQNRTEIPLAQTTILHLSEDSRLISYRKQADSLVTEYSTFIVSNGHLHLKPAKPIQTLSESKLSPLKIVDLTEDKLLVQPPAESDKPSPVTELSRIDRVQFESNLEAMRSDTAAIE